MRVQIDLTRIEDSYSAANTPRSLDLRSMAANTYHVIPQIGGGWSVRKAGAARASRTFDTKQDAIGHARDVAKKNGVELVIHGRDGTIRERSEFARVLTRIRRARKR